MAGGQEAYHEPLLKGRDRSGRAAVVMSRPPAFPPSRLKGVTLVELLIVLVLLGMVTGITGVALRRGPRSAESPTQSVERTRRAVIRSGQPATTQDSLHRPIRFLPDGRAIGPGINPLTGRVRASP